MFSSIDAIVLHTSGNHNIVVADKLPKPLILASEFFTDVLINSLSSLSETNGKVAFKTERSRIRAEEVCLQTKSHWRLIVS